MKTLLIPLMSDSDYNSKRLYPQYGHWLEMSCPKCGESNNVGTQTPLFYCGYDGHFYCDSCGHEYPKAYALMSIDFTSTPPTAVIAKVEGFAGKLTHCKNIRVEEESI